MDIFLSINNREQVIQLPVLPQSFRVKTGMKNETYETIGLGEIKLIGMPILAAISIESFFQAKDYPFLRDRTYKSWEYVEMINGWKVQRIPMRLVITDTPINMLCVVESFEYGIQDGTGDVYYSLSLAEFKLVEL